jgi:hypothetical protein
MPVNEKDLQMLAPFLEGDRPTHLNVDPVDQSTTREWYLHCPLHEDVRRSASLNIDKGVFYCNICGGMSFTELLRRQPEWVIGLHATNGKTLNLNGAVAKPIRRITDGMIAGWHSALLSNPAALAWLRERRGLNLRTAQEFELGYVNERLYSIPVRSYEGDIWNIRYYDPNPRDDKRKIWGETGYNSPCRLFPLSVFAQEPHEIVICEGEWDALLLNQFGIPAITRTGAADVWIAEWGQWFAGRIVYVCHDRDTKGQHADGKVAKALRHVAEDVRKIELPYPVVEKHGQDVTNFLLDNMPDAFRDLMARAVPLKKQETDPSASSAVGSSAASNGASHEVPGVPTVHVLDTFAAENVGKPLNVIVTIKGRKEPGYTIPKKVRLTCSQDAGNKCAICPLRAANGEAMVEITPDDPIVLSLMDSTNQSMFQVIADSYGVPGGKCFKLQHEVHEHQAVEVLFGRPALDYSDGSIIDPDKAAAYKTIKITSVGRHNTAANNTVSAVGALQPNPRSQGNEFLAHELIPLGTSVDHFELNDRTRHLMRRFQTDRPLRKLADINRALAEHVTRIHGRPQMHAVMDLTFHSVLGFNFAGERVDRGWLESLIVGDTRTGKSLAAQRMVQHYGAGEVISCEAASFAGVVGGLQTIGQKDWVVTWGVVPLNDRRLVVLDEISGLSHEDIAQMSDIRSSGQAKLIKIQQETTWARTRLLWLGNPRNTTMANYTYGVDAIKPLVGNAEDVARFDLAMAVTLFDVPSETINQPVRGGEFVYTSEACHALLMWSWTRTPEQIQFTPEAEDAVFNHANDMGKQYIEDPPLIQAANIRIKIARVAAALAARTYSTDASGEVLRVGKQHVVDACRFINLLYGMQSFGYRERSRERIGDRLMAEQNRDKMSEYLKSRPQLAKYLRSAGKFRRQDLDEIMNLSRDESNAIISTLYENRMVRKVLGDIVVEPTLHSLLRELQL